MRTSWRKKKMLHGPNSVLMRTDHSSPAQRCMWLSTPINNHVKIIGNRSTLLINLNSTARWNLVHKVPPHINEDMHKDILLLVGNLSFICPKLLREHRRCPRNTRKTWHTVRLPQNTCFHVWPQVVILEVHLSCVWSELLEFAPLIQLHFLLLESMACLCVSESVCVWVHACALVLAWWKTLRWNHVDVNLHFPVVSDHLFDCARYLCLLPSEFLRIHLQSRWGHYSHLYLQAQTCPLAGVYLPPLKLLFNPNLSHSTLNKGAVTWSSFWSGTTSE